MKHALRIGILFVLCFACRSPAIGTQTAAVDDDQDLSIRFCGHFQGSANTASLDCADTPEEAYSAARSRRSSECHGSLACLNSAIYLLIPTPTPPVSSSYMLQYRTAARQIELFMVGKDLGGYQRTLEELTNGAQLIGKIETENLRREYETKLQKVTKDKIASVGSSAVGAQQAVFVRTRDFIDYLKNLNKRYRPIVNQLADGFLMLATKYQTLRNTETAAINDLTAAVEQASQADTDASAAALTHVIDVARKESSQTNEFAVDASRFRIELAAAASQYSDEIAPHRDFMEEQHLPALDFTRKSSVSVDSMVRYAEQRDARMADAAERVIVQIQLRLHALQAAAAAQGVRQALADAALLKASTEFLRTVNVRIAEILRTPEKSPLLGISLLSAMQRDMVAFLQLEPPCLAQGTSTSWMNTGCNVLAPNFSKARQFLTTRIPGVIRIDAAMFRREGSPAELVAAMEQELAAGNLEGACRTHDELAQIVERQTGGSR